MHNYCTPHIIKENWEFLDPSLQLHTPIYDKLLKPRQSFRVTLYHSFQLRIVKCLRKSLRQISEPNADIVVHSFRQHITRKDMIYTGKYYRRRGEIYEITTCRSGRMSSIFMFLWPCIVSKAWRKNTNKMQQYKWFIVNSGCWLLTTVSTCFGHLYAHHQKKRPRVTAYGF